MIPRHLEKKIRKYAKQYPIIALVGPRQSGKTTLVKSIFSDYEYVSLENIDMRTRATKDPRGFLEDFGPYVILDEVQRVPELVSYLQELVDTNQEPGQYILTGSSQFLLSEGISQTLAGRIITFKLYPLTYTELNHFPADSDFNTIYQKFHTKRPAVSQSDLYQLLTKGLYPRIHDKNLDSYKWYENYILTYVERDVRSLLNVRSLRLFEQFLLLCASQSATLLNYSTLSNSLGVAVSTIKEWISILEASGLIFILSPYHKNFSKRVVKMPKIYFVDTGLLCHLLSIRNVDQLKSHPLLGNIFETFIISECYKRFYNLGEIPPLYFWHDQSKNEIDLLLDMGTHCFPIEIKLSQVFHNDFQTVMKNWLKIEKNPATKGLIIYTGKDHLGKSSSIQTIPWYYL